MAWQQATIAALAVVLGAAAPAQAKDDANKPTQRQQISEAWDVLDFAMTLAAQAHVISLQCRIGDPERWRQVASTFDRRLQHCTEQNVEWAVMIVQATDKADLKDLMKTTGLGLAELLFRFKAEQSREFFSTKDYCPHVRANALLRNMLDPGSVPREAVEAARAEEDKERSQHHDAWMSVSLFEAFRALGEDQQWITAPCTQLVLPK